MKYPFELHLLPVFCCRLAEEAASSENMGVSSSNLEHGGTRSRGW